MVIWVQMKSRFPRTRPLVRLPTLLIFLGIVDGSGVLYDPAGLNREELVRLATKRLMVSHFDVNLLSPKGFRVLVDETFVRLPGNINVVLTHRWHHH